MELHTFQWNWNFQTRMPNKRLKHRALRALDSQQVARRLGVR